MATSSTLANLASKTSPAAVREAKPAGLNNGQSVNFSGQYLYDRLIENNEAEQTRMNLVREAIKQVDVQQWKKSLADMVEIAKKHGPSKEKTARNTQTVLRNSYGALRFAKDVLESKFGLTEASGFNIMQIAAPQALKEKGIKWDGTPKPTEEQRAERERVRDEASVMQEIQKANPIQTGESVADWTKRCLSKYDEAMANHEEVMLQRRIDTVVREIITKNRDIIGAVIGRLPEMLDEIERDEQAALEYVDSNGNHPFVKEDGTPDVAAHKKFLLDEEQRQKQQAAMIQKPEGAPVH